MVKSHDLHTLFLKNIGKSVSSKCIKVVKLFCICCSFTATRDTTCIPIVIYIPHMAQNVIYLPATLVLIFRENLYSI